ncbi:MAG TPA: molybdate ABC transporter substrate-binding protein [Phytomonospora sp.]
MRARWTRGLAAGLIALASVGLTACGDGGGETGGGEVTGEITVFAAASLTESFTMIGADFEAANPGTKVVFNFAGSSALATQIGQGAPADVFASAAPANMATVADAGDVDGEAVTFVKNQLVIAVPEGNPKGVTGLADLVDPDVKVALCAEQVPCGAAAKKALEAASVALTPVTFEQDVKSALSKVTLGEVDAALVYRTDAAAAASDVDGVEFAESAGAVNEYPIAVLKNAPNTATARAFVDYVLSEPGMAVLTTAGFQAP